MSNINSILKVLHNFFEGDETNFSKDWSAFYCDFLLDPENIYDGDFIKEEWRKFPNRELVIRVFNAANEYDLAVKRETLDLYFTEGDLDEMRETLYYRMEDKSNKRVFQWECETKEGTKLNINIKVQEF